MNSLDAQIVNKILTEKLRVMLIQTDETGELLWAIESVDYPEFWVEAFVTFTEAKTFCDDYGLPYEIA